MYQKSSNSIKNNKNILRYYKLSSDTILINCSYFSRMLNIIFQFNISNKYYKESKVTQF